MMFTDHHLFEAHIQDRQRELAAAAAAPHVRWRSTFRWHHRWRRPRQPTLVPTVAARSMSRA